MTNEINYLKTIISDEVRAQMSKNPKLGAGNFLAEAIAQSPAPAEKILFLEKPLRTFWGETFRALSYLDLKRISEVYASWYRKQGVQPHDPVFVYFDDGIEYLIHYLALTQIGAIGVLTNGNMPPATAYNHAKNTSSVGIFTDAPHRKALETLVKANDFKFFTIDSEISEDVTQLEPVKFFQHESDDPIMIAHSSGTTGTPKPVLLQHQAFFYGVRYRLGVPRIPGGETILSSLPHSHNCAIAYIMLAMLSGTPVHIVSDHSGMSVLKQIEQFKPKMVVSFPQVYVEMNDHDLNSFNLSSVNLWFNGGDAAHESHIRALIKQGTRVKDGKVIPGSIFIDGMGSSEMGFSLFRHVHTPETNHYNRCVGTPLEWVDAQILSEDGEKLPPHTVGRLGVKAPSVTTGYWNNSLLTFKSRLSGYFLTGDLAYKDENNRFYHVDRVPDLIRTERGLVFGLQTEELLLSKFPEISDCTVFGQARTDSKFVNAVAFVRFHPNKTQRPLEESLKVFNVAIKNAGLLELDDLRDISLSEVPLGSTGKVLKRILRTQEASPQPTT